jgi:hypothetical protein
LVYPFEQIFEAIEPVLPEAGHLLGPIDQWGQGAELRTVVRLAAFVSLYIVRGLVFYPVMFL